MPAASRTWNRPEPFSVDLFIVLLGKLLPLYLLIGLGMLSGRYLGIGRETVAALLLYVIVPAVSFYGVATAPRGAGMVVLPLLFFAVCSLMGCVFYALSAFFWRDSTRNIFAYVAGTGNNGYFGIPLILALTGSQKAFSLAVVAGIGFLLYEVTVGFLLIARGRFTPGDGIRRLLRLPMIYAFFLGLLWNLAGWSFPQAYADLALSFRGAFTVLGMMLVGLGLSRIRHLFLDLRFTGLLLLAKFVCWPLLVWAAVSADAAWTHLLSPLAREVAEALSVVPLAANGVVYATQFKLHPEKAASAVFASTVLALLYIPLVTALFPR
jgi:predicted permease